MADSETRKLQVANARPEDSGRGLARLSRATMNALGLNEGDVVEIVGKRATPARAVLPYSEDEGLEILRLDGLQRANAGVGSGDFVEVHRSSSQPAQRVVFAPAQANLRLHGSGEALKRSFGMRPLTAGDIVATAGQQRIGGDMPPSVRAMLNAPAYALQEVRLVVVSTVPRGVVHIDADSEVELRPEYQEPKETRRADVTYDDIGGLGTTVDQVREMVELPLRYPELLVTPLSSASPDPRLSDPLMARARSICARFSSGPRRKRLRSFSSTRSIRSHPNADKPRVRRRNGWSPNY